MSHYAEKTKVSTSASKAEIEATLNRFGIRDSGCVTMDGLARVLFKHNGRPYCISIQMPDPKAEEFRFTPARRLERTDDEAYEAWEQASRIKWRELALLIKAKLVAISNEAVRFEDEFLAYAMLPDRSTVGERADALLEECARTGQFPELLPGMQKALPKGQR